MLITCLLYNTNHIGFLEKKIHENPDIRDKICLISQTATIQSAMVMRY